MGNINNYTNNPLIHKNRRRTSNDSAWVRQFDCTDMKPLIICRGPIRKEAIDVFREMDSLGGVIAAMEQRYQRSKIQEAGHRIESQIYSGERPVIGLNKYISAEPMPSVPLARTPPRKQRLQVERLQAFKRKHARRAPEALQRLENVTRAGGNVFGELVHTVEVCSLGQITACLTGVVGKFRPMV